MSENGFRGPLFIVAFPRSGNTLLGTLLNEHPRISIPVTETSFMPRLVRRFGNPPRLHVENRLHQFYRMFSDTIFFERRRRQNVVMSERDLAERADLNSWASIFEAISKFYAPKKLTGDMIWGDRSPRHLTSMNFLKSIFPAAKFLHIIRDPRDVCLSAKKVWGRSLYRSATLWRERVAAARRFGVTLGGDYHEVAFESLLEDPHTTLRDVCHYLQVDFTPNMLQLSAPHTSLGDARGARTILPDNKGKYRSQLSPSTIRRIEAIVYPTAIAAGYQLEFAEAFRPLAPWSSTFLLCYDGAMTAKRYSSFRGVRWTARYVGRRGVERVKGLHA